jgi:hypothetical protein
MGLRSRILDPNWGENAEAWCGRHPLLCKVAHALGLLLLVGLLWIVLPRLSHADTYLPIVALDKSCIGQAVANCQPAQVFRTPVDGDPVRISSTDAATWDANHRWVDWATVAVGQKVEVCKIDLPNPTPMSSGGSNCTAYGFYAKAAPAAPSPPISVPASSGAQATFTWNAVSLDANGSAVSGVTYSVYMDGAKLVQGLAAPMYTATGLAAGTHAFDVTASSAAGESAHSASLAVSVTAPPPAVPAAPTGLHTVALAAYDLIKGNDSLTVKQIGTVPSGTSCISTIQALGYYGIARAKVTLLGTSTRPQVVLAKCGG